MQQHAVLVISLFDFRASYPQHCFCLLLQSASSWSNGAWPCGLQTGPPWSRFATTLGWGRQRQSHPSHKKSRSPVTSASGPSTQTLRQAQARARRASEDGSDGLKRLSGGKEGVGWRGWYGLKAGSLLAQLAHQRLGTEPARKMYFNFPLL